LLNKYVIGKKINAAGNSGLTLKEAKGREATLDAVRFDMIRKHTKNIPKKTTLLVTALFLTGEDVIN
jgi:hypothetical protein